MLQYFIENKSIPQVRQICENINNLKCRIINKDYNDSYELFNSSMELFDKVKEIALDKCNEKLANAQFVFKAYFKLFCDLSSYFEMLIKKEYKKSWDKLQDCLDDIRLIGRFTEIENRFEVDELHTLFEQYETLYPYSVFISSEYIISKSHCSICGKSMQSLDCHHRKGYLYWGELAVEHVDEISSFNSISLVSNPDDKRCICEDANDKRTKEEKFYILDNYLKLNQEYLRQFDINETEEYREKETVVKTGRNKPCPCGSGKKFKNCCGKELYYKNINYKVKILSKVDLIML